MDWSCKIFVNITFYKPEKVLKKTHHQCLYAYRHDGMFSRLLCFLNAIRLSEKLNLQRPVLFWERRPISGNQVHGYDSGFHEIFDVDQSWEVREIHESCDLDYAFGWDYMVGLEGESEAEVISGLSKLSEEINLKNCPLKSLKGQSKNVKWVGVYCRAGDADS